MKPRTPGNYWNYNGDASLSLPIVGNVWGMNKSAADQQFDSAPEANITYQKVIGGSSGNVLVLGADQLGSSGVSRPLLRLVGGWSGDSTTDRSTDPAGAAAHSSLAGLSWRKDEAHLHDTGEDVPVVAACRLHGRDCIRDSVRSPPVRYRHSCR